MRKEKILVVAHEPVREWLEIVLNEDQFDVLPAAEAYRWIELFEAHRPNLVISDLTLRDLDGLNLLQSVKDADNKVPVIMMTAGEELWPIIEAMERGAYDCIEKPVEICRLRQIIAGALDIKEIPNSNGVGKSGPSAELDIGRLIVGKTSVMAEIRGKLGLISSRRTNVLVQGESGTGKGLVCRVIHNSGATRGHPFVAVDMPGLPEPLLEKVLFGQVKEARSGRTKDKKGLFEVAGAGTILLNEISEISPSVQEKLFGVLRRKEFEPVGGKAAIPLKARVIGTTEKNLGELVRNGKFREDLFYRIAVCSIDIPPLRERKEDIPLLFVHLLRKVNKELHKSVRRISGEVIDVLRNKEWTGNVSELESVLTRAVAAAEGDALQKEHLASCGNAKQTHAETPHELRVDSSERDHIKYVLEETNWDKKEAARLLKISRQTLYNKIKTYRILPS